MARVEANGIRIEVEQAGKEGGPAVLLIRGLGTQLIQWPEAFVGGLVDGGLRVVMFDNRDVGLSQKFDAAGTPDMAGLMQGRAAAAYSVEDMADDASGVLDAVGIDRAHVFGISMGGMIAQWIAAKRPQRTLSLFSVMSSSGAPGLPGPTPEAAAALTSQPEYPDDRECVIAHGMNTRRVIGSPGYPTDDATLRAEVEAAYDRCYHPPGVARQLAAVVADTGRVDRLASIRVPTLVIHGEDDPLVPLEAGRDTARRIPGASLEVVPGMGHEIPRGLAAHLANLVCHQTHLARA